MDDFKQNLITKVLKNEVTKALGCTEVGLIGYAVSLCNVNDPKKIEKITLKLDLSSFKNAYSVGVPNTGKFGIIPAVVGGFLGKSENKLLIFDDITYSEELEECIKEKLEIQVLDETTLYCKVEIFDNPGNFYESLIKDNHLNVLIPQINNEKVVSDKISLEEKENYKNLEISDFLGYLGSIPEDIENLIIETIDTNKKLVKCDFLKYGNDILTNMVNKTASACKTRMSGENMPAMSVAKSGNMGIMATLPIICYDESTENNNEKLIKSVLFSVLTTIYAAYHTKGLSSMCGCVNKGGIGALSGLCYYIYGKNQEKLTIKQFKIIYCKYSGHHL